VLEVKTRRVANSFACDATEMAALSTLSLV
jgi:hypothetical protein